MTGPPTERGAVRGLGTLAAGLFFLWGAAAAAKGIWDLFFGGPEANLFSPEPWAFVTRAQWFRYAGFELAYGLACLAVGSAIRRYSRRLPEWVERPIPDI